MDIQISGKHLEVTPALKSRIEEKISGLQGIFDQITSIHITLSANKDRHTAKGHIMVPSSTFDAKCVTEDMYKSIDDLFDKLRMDIKKYKGKREDHHK